MFDINRHKFFLLQVLKDIYADTELASSLGFKGGTALMLFHELPRFSVDLDFNLMAESDAEGVYGKLRKILLSYGTMRDEARKHYGMILVLDYENGRRNLKIEVSNRIYPDRYELRDYLGIPMNVMTLEYMFTHKLMALLDRSALTNRDIFDCWFCMNQRVMLKRSILDIRLNCSFDQYIDNCIDVVSGVGSTRILDGMGELMDNNLKNWVRLSLVKEFVTLAKMYRDMPLFDAE
jgi:predicted nucleotidyltransferase component of viral defense system